MRQFITCCKKAATFKVNCYLPDEKNCISTDLILAEDLIMSCYCKAQVSNVSGCFIKHFHYAFLKILECIKNDSNTTIQKTSFCNISFISTDSSEMIWSNLQNICWDILMLYKIFSYAWFMNDSFIEIILLKLFDQICKTFVEIF